MRLFQLLKPQRALVVRLALVGYVAAAALRASPERGPSAWVVAFAGCCVAAASSRRRGPVGWALFGLAVAIASAVSGGTATAEFAWIDAAGFVGAAIGTFAAVTAIATTPASPGLLPGRVSSARAVAIAACAPWIAATFGELHGGAARDLTARLAAPLAIGVVLGHTLVARAARELELDAQARLTGAAGAAVTTATALIIALVASGADAAAIGRIVGPVGFAAVASIALESNPRTVARLSRRLAVLAAAGGGATIALTALALISPDRGAAIVTATAAVLLLIGALGERLEAMALGESAALTRQIEKATRDVLADEPEEALRAALAALRPADTEAATPELYTLVPPRCTWVDAAGYAHERHGELPADLTRHAAGEPQGVLRIEVLEALEVKRPDLRGLLQWMRDCGALAATLIVRGGEVEGALLLPRASRTRPLTLEEACGLRSLAQGLAMAASARAALERSLTRERAAAASEAAESDRAAKLGHALALQEEQNLRATDRLARPAAIGIYSAASRLAYEAIVRRAKTLAPMFLHAPSGVDPVPYVARAHLAGPRASSPLVVVDGTSSRDHDLGRWTDPRTSPLALADGGALLLVDGAALPLEIQRLVAQTLAERRTPWPRADAIDFVLAFTSSSTPASLIADGRLDPGLAVRLGAALESPIALPRLRQRPDDLHALLSDGLAREGLRVRGSPLGLDAAATALLVEHAFAGEDAELHAIVQRLAATCTGDVIRAADVAQLGIFAPSAQAAPPRHGAEPRLRRVRKKT